MASDNEFSGTFSGGPTELNSGQDQAEQAARIAQEARERAYNAADDAAAQVGQAAGRARASIDKLSGQNQATGAQISGKANEQLNQAMNVAGQQLQNAAQQVRQLAPEGQAREIAGKAAEALERGGNYLQSTDPNTAVGDLEQLIRRYPLQSIAVGLGLGFLLGRGRK